MLQQQNAVVPDIRLRLDADGVFMDFAEAVRQRLGFDPDAPGADTKRMWEMAGKPGFWESLGEMPGAQELWTFVAPHAPSFITGVGSNPTECKAGKKASLRNHFGCLKVAVVESSRKAELCRPGDILVDDRQANIDAWEAAGGIGVLHTDTASTIAKLRALGLDGKGGVSLELVAEVERRRADPRFKRDGYTGYVLSPKAQSDLTARFGTVGGVAGPPYRLVCQHITRQFPARLDTIDDAQPDVEVVGEFRDERTGHWVLAVTVDGELVRPDGLYYHITYALDDSPEAEAAYKARGDKRPTAGESNAVLQAAVAAGGGNVAALRNLPPERRLKIDVDFALLDQLKMSKLRRPPVPPVPVVETTEAIVFPSGTVGRRIVRTKGDDATTFTECTRDDGLTWRKHGEDAPAIQRCQVSTGKILFAAWYGDGVEVAPPAPSPAPSPR